MGTAGSTGQETRKVTVCLPADLLRHAQQASGQGITETIKRGLRAVAAARAYEGLLRMEGKVKLDLHLDELRRDREW